MFGFNIDFWTLWGLFAQGLFFSRFVIQLYMSEKEGKTVTPIIFWYISLLGSSMTLVYAFVRKDIVFLITGTMQIAVYLRSLKIALKT